MLERPAFTVGIEEEYLVVDRDTRDLIEAPPPEMWDKLSEDEIQRILAELSNLVADQGEALKRLVDRIAELDMIFARARYAEAIEAVQPTPPFVPVSGHLGPV